MKWKLTATHVLIKIEKKHMKTLLCLHQTQRKSKQTYGYSHPRPFWKQIIARRITNGTVERTALKKHHPSI